MNWLFSTILKPEQRLAYFLMAVTDSGATYVNHDNDWVNFWSEYSLFGLNTIYSWHSFYFADDFLIQYFHWLYPTIHWIPLFTIRDDVERSLLVDSIVLPDLHDAIKVNCA